MSAIVVERENELKNKAICRFCLSQENDKLGSIFEQNANSSAPLNVQIMACVSIDAYDDDGMPGKICADCRTVFEYTYNFKRMCKRAETLLRQYPLTAKWPEPLVKPILQLPILPKKEKISVIQAEQSVQPYLLNTKSYARAKNPNITTKPKTFPTQNGAKKLLNSDPADSPEPPAPKRLKKETFDQEALKLLNKMENNEELSLDDVQRLVASNELLIEDEPPKIQNKPKLLNKSSMRILNKEAEIEFEPRLSKPQVTRDEDGNVAIVTEILDPNQPYETEADPIKSAEPVQTNIFPCPHCERSFPLLQLRDIHMANHVRQRSFQCKDCDKSFFSKYDLQKHTVVHTGARPFKCTVCDRAFTRATLLYRHEKSHTDVPKQLCVHCERTFLSKEELEKHTEHHLKIRPFKCKICNKGFAFKQGMERHEAIHSQEQPFPCQYCDQSFSTSSKLARHLTAHAGKRPYPCKFCSKSYLLSHHLTRHLRSHKQEIYSCTTCNKKFNSRYNLIEHSVVHAIKTLACPLCKEDFANVEEVVVHVKQHADTEIFACVFCDLEFMENQKLEEHVNREHAEDMVAYNEDENNDDKRTEYSNSDQTDANYDYQQTIEEYLIDELQDEDDAGGSQIIIPATNNPIHIKQEKVDEEQEFLTDAPKIVSQIVLKTSNVPKDVELIPLANETNETQKTTSIENVKYVEIVDSNAQKRKPRKTAAKNVENANIVKQTIRQVAVKPVINQQTAQKTTAKQAIQQTTQQTAQHTTQQANAPKKLKQTALTSMLKELPKSISVRRTTTDIVNVKAEHNSAAVITANAIKKYAVETVKKEKNETPNIKKSPKLQAITTRTRTSQNSNNNNTSNTRTSTTTDDSTTIAETNNETISPTNISTDSTESTATKTEPKTNAENTKPVGKKIRQMVVSKAQAAAMVREGKVYIKDGNMILKMSAMKSKNKDT